MLSFVAAFTAGVWCLQNSSSLSQTQLLMAGAVPLLFVPGKLRLIGAFAAGFLWAYCYAQLMLMAQLPEQLHGETVHLTGVVSALPQKLAGRTRFELRVEKLHSLQRDWPFRGRVRIDDYSGEISPQVGERWELAVRLRLPRNYANPGGFDLERWYFERAIAARASLIPRASNTRLAVKVAYPVQQIRQQVAERLRGIHEPGQPRAMMLALLLGDKSELDSDTRDVLKRSGTAHLMAISGLHIGMFAALAVWLMRVVISRALPAAFARPGLLALTALLAATSYAALAGWAIPTRRALIMLLVYTGCRLLGLRIAWPQLVAVCLFALLIVDPMVVLSASLWLSLYAVAVIACLGLRRTAAKNPLWLALRVHLTMCFVMVPILIVVFGQFSVIAPLANLVCVPVVGLLLLPLIMLSTLLLYIAPWFAAIGFNLTAKVLAILLQMLEQLVELPLASIGAAGAHPGVVISASIAAAVALAPPRLGLKPLLLVWCLPIVMLRPAAPPAGQFQVDMLDVGQGLSVLVRTHRHSLLFDTGPRFPSGFSTADAVVLPYLRHVGIPDLDMLFLSHSDNDHAGGMNSLLQALDVDQLMAGGDMKFPQAQRCHDGQRWSWDGVRFEVLHPGAAFSGSENDRSCVLRVSAGETAVLFAADIEVQGENELLRRHADLLTAQVLIAPHHGSQSSSSGAFVDAVGARFVLIPAGFENRYGFPHESVLRRYEATGARIFTSGQSGMLSFRSWQLVLKPGYRHQNRRYWHRD